ncbi:MAG TPA: Gfo/Idh/MocA family oxidoreductase [Pseudolabrys sp.]|nr:Gfo/Idh/MocA family oxidoreductase [Pseudolabrys sp.]
MEQAVPRTLRLGVAGLGRAFSVMLPTFLRDGRVRLVAAADPRPEARASFAAEFGGRTYAAVEELFADAEVEAVYIATPHQHHAAHARAAAARGKHLLIEKPIALTLADAQAITEAARKAKVHLIVGHSHSFDAPILRTRALIDSGTYGAVRMISAFNYTDFLYRPRRPEELDTAQGGGALFNQAPHQVDIVRLLGGGRVKSVRAQAGAWDASRPTEGAYSALMTFKDGAFASLSYSGYGHFDSDEFQGWIGEMGQAKPANPRRERRRFADAAAETAFKAAHIYGGADWTPPAAQELAHQHFGTVIVSCERADLRPLPNGVVIYDDSGARLDALPLPAVPRAEVIDELYDAIVNGRPPLHGGAWATATLEVCLAMLASAREGKEIALAHQVAVP